MSADEQRMLLDQGELSPADDAPATGFGNVGGFAPSSQSSRNKQMLISIAAIAIGASFGAVLRWYLANRLNSLFPSLPPGTLAANLLGAYLIGLALAIFLSFPTLSPEWRLLIVTGFLGGLTTFSTFSAEVVTALLEARWGWAIGTIAIHVSGSIGLTLVGFATVKGILILNR